MTKSVKLYKDSVDERPDTQGPKQLGLTIHYGLTSKTRSAKLAEALRAIHEK